MPFCEKVVWEEREREGGINAKYEASERNEYENMPKSADLIATYAEKRKTNNFSLFDEIKFQVSIFSIT